MKCSAYMIVICVLALPFFSGCDETGLKADLPQGADGDDEWEMMELPAFSADCSLCHDLEELKTALSDELAGPREWMSEHGAGMLRLPDPAFSTGGMTFENPWKNRARHTDADLHYCAYCHPVRSDGMGHGVIMYPKEVYADAFSPGADCASSCHHWMKRSIVSEGFENSEGAKPVYNGTIRPYEMLSAVDNAHTRLFKSGAHMYKPTMRIASLMPGCAGCHNVREEGHGAVMGCLDCHRMGGYSGVLHQYHSQAIEEEIADKDPGFSGPVCGYCHLRGEELDSRERATCYNCHLSGHQPLDENGKAHFWN